MTDVRDLAARHINFSAPAVYVDQHETDEELVKRCLGGDDGAFERLVLRYQRVLFTVAARMVGNQDEANDATQNALVNAYRKLHTFDPTRRFFSWLYRILLNECLNVRRDRRVYEPLTPDVARTGSAADALEAAERRARVQAAIVSLPAQQREVVVLKYFAELSYDEIADATGVAAKTVKSRLHSARERLAVLLDMDAGR
jgi:RNA polymerase sigma-70 factor (ECF subfamily)